jgi:hypothetical protein
MKTERLKARRKRDAIPSNVAKEFERLALQAIASGRCRFSARTLVELVRWHTAIEQKGEPFKINNNLTPRLARWFLRKHPEHAGFFEMREQRRARDA